MALDPGRVVSQLRELQELTGDENGAQRVAWTDTWNTARTWLDGLLDGLPLERERDAAGNDWWTLRGESRARRPDRGSHRLGPERRLARRVPQRRRRRRGAAPDRRAGHAAGHDQARQLGRRGGRALRPLALRLLGRGRLDERPGRAAPADRQGRDLAPRRARCERRRPRPGARGAIAARNGRGLPRAPHRAGAGARVDGHSARRRARHLRRRALAHHVDGPGRACRLDADGQAPRRARRRGEARARAARDRRPGRERRGLHLGRRRLPARDRHLRRRDRRAAPRPAPSRRRQPGGASPAGPGGERALRRRGEPRGRPGSGSGTSSRSCSTRP